VGNLHFFGILGGVWCIDRGAARCTHLRVDFGDAAAPDGVGAVEFPNRWRQAPLLAPGSLWRKMVAEILRDGMDWDSMQESGEEVRIEAKPDVLACLRGLVSEALRTSSDAEALLREAAAALQGACVPSLGAEAAAGQLAESLKALGCLIDSYLPVDPSAAPMVVLRGEEVAHLQEASREAAALVAAWQEPVAVIVNRAALMPVSLKSGWTSGSEGGPQKKNSPGR
jgi:hypothetical protein